MLKILILFLLVPLLTETAQDSIWVYDHNKPADIFTRYPGICKIYLKNG
jgi:hypothetical protein